MTEKINRLIKNIRQIPNVTNIPINEIQNYNPPHIPIDSIKVIGKKIWDGGREDRETNDKLTESIKPTISEENILEDIRENDNEEVWGSLNKNGLEAIAWYKSFHYSNYWGIYISYSGLLRFAKKFNKFINDEEISIDLAWNALMSHEAIHYAVDVACAKIEAITQQPIYIPGKSKNKGQAGYSVDEERIAQGALLSYIKSNSRKLSLLANIDSMILYEFALDHSSRMPDGYKEGYKAVTMPNFKKYADVYLSDLIRAAGLINPNSFFDFSSLELSSLMPLKNNRGGYTPGKTDWSECPIYVVNDSNYSGITSGLISFLTLFNIHETQKFNKKISPQYVNDWHKTKQLLGDPVYKKYSPTLDFKRWRSEDSKYNNTRAWSVRVGGTKSNMRAHLDEQLETGNWEADRFGNADEMGHHKNRK
jgi:hypothetical protein